MSTDWPRFPTDEMSLCGLIEACSMNDETGRTHLQDYLDMTARVKSVTNEETGERFGDMDSALEASEDGSVFFVEHEPGTEPHSPHTVIVSLAEEILRLRGGERTAAASCCSGCTRTHRATATGQRDTAGRLAAGMSEDVVEMAAYDDLYARFNDVQARLDAAEAVVEAARQLQSGMNDEVDSRAYVKAWEVAAVRKALDAFDGLARSGTPE